MDDFFGRGEKDAHKNSPEYLLRMTQHTLLLRQMGRYLPEELTAEIMQSYFEQMFKGEMHERITALHCWTDGILENPSVPMSTGYPETKEDALDVLVSIIKNSERLLRMIAIQSVSELFSQTCHHNAARCLAKLICDESLEQSERLRCYFGLWRVTSKPLDYQAYLTSGMILEYVEESRRNRQQMWAEREHFQQALVPSYQPADFCFDSYIRWDWVKSFID